VLVLVRKQASKQKSRALCVCVADWLCGPV
jgi:hypothetical protein